MNVIIATPLTAEAYVGHSGIRGMKWGIRRFQNPDGSLTEAGRKRYGVGDAKVSVNGKPVSSSSAARSSSGQTGSTRRTKVSDLSDKELSERISRLQKEQQLKQLMAGEESTFKKAFSQAKDTAITSLTVGAGLVLLRSVINKTTDSNLGSVILSAAGKNFAEVASNKAKKPSRDDDEDDSKSKTARAEAKTAQMKQRTAQMQERTKQMEERIKRDKARDENRARNNAIRDANREKANQQALARQIERDEKRRDRETRVMNANRARMNRIINNYQKTSVNSAEVQRAHMDQGREVMNDLLSRYNNYWL